MAKIKNHSYNEWYIIIQKSYFRISNYPKEKFNNTHRNLHVEVFNMVTKRKFWSSCSCRSCRKLTLQVMAQYCKMQVAYADMIPLIILNATSWKELCSSKSLFFSFHIFMIFHFYLLSGVYPLKKWLEISHWNMMS